MSGMIDKEEGELQHELTILLQNVNAGERDAEDQLIASVYEQLRKIAQRQLSRERSDHTLQPTELVHEAYVKMAGHLEERDWQNRSHFFAAAAEAMRRILINYARSRNAVKRGSGQRPEAINVLELAGEQDPEMILVVDEAIQHLKEQDPKLGELVHLRFFAGLSIEQTAEVMETSTRSVARHWNFARAWLTKEIEKLLE
ncbi:ECF-type sigma factor [Akkermansiaceae bacterium]|nr:ECF-type sigma factor [Akkermansiaceae bacterium]